MDRIEREGEKIRLRRRSRALPARNLRDYLKFYLEPRVLRMKYELAMIAIEDNAPQVYRAFVAMGLPKHSLERFCQK